VKSTAHCQQQRKEPATNERKERDGKERRPQEQKKFECHFGKEQNRLEGRVTEKKPQGPLPTRKKGCNA